MTKQEKIREGMETILRMKEMTKVTRDAILEFQLKFLKSEGVKFVELPSIWDGKGEVMSALEYKKKLVIEELI